MKSGDKVTAEKHGCRHASPAGARMLKKIRREKFGEAELQMAGEKPQPVKLPPNSPTNRGRRNELMVKS